MLKDKYAFITGASRGLGLEMAIAMADSGLNGLSITCAPGSDESHYEIQEELHRAADLIRASGAEVNPIMSNVGNSNDCDKAVSSHLSKFPSVDILVNNAGKAGRYAHKGEASTDISHHDLGGIAEIIDTNLTGPYYLLHFALPHMRLLKDGRIINISKRTDSMHRGGWTPYGPTKAALEAATIAWAEALYGTGITVNSLSPGGAVDTKFGTGKISGHGIDPGAIRPIIVWLASDESSALTGCRFVADRWKYDDTPLMAALGCQEEQIFPRPSRNTPLVNAWKK